MLRQLRHWRSRKFFEKTVHCTPYHFHDWKDAPSALDLDVIVCGSDQVWHCGDYGDPRPYLLESAPLHKCDGTRIRTVAYAASFGFSTYPNGYLPVFVEGLRRFDHISVRESQGVELARIAGADAVQVLDPTLLIDRNFWLSILSDSVANRKLSRSGRVHRVVCYFISQDIEDAYPALESFARRSGCRVDVISTQLRPHLGSARKRRNYLRSLLGFYPHVHLSLAAGPVEFLELFASADSCITDSFHALMFSVIFGLNCRVLAPSSKARQLQFSRFESFTRYVNGPLISSDVASAVDSIEKQRCTYRWQELDRERLRCLQWLEKAIDGEGAGSL